MAYIDKYTSRRPNIGAASAVLIFEALLAVAIFRGLAIKFLPPKAPPHTIADNIPLPSPTPTPSAVPTPDRHPLDPAPQPSPSSAPLGLPTGPAASSPQPSPFPSPQPTFQPPQPTPSPVALGKAATPRGNPGSWVSDNDYPTAELRAGNQGRVGFALAIGTDGRVTACRVTSSSGHPGLDTAACTLITRRARFAPAMGADGQPRAGSYSSSIRWVIPD